MSSSGILLCFYTVKSRMPTWIYVLISFYFFIKIFYSLSPCMLISSFLFLLLLFFFSVSIFEARFLCVTDVTDLASLELTLSASNPCLCLPSSGLKVCTATRSHLLISEFQSVALPVGTHWEIFICWLCFLAILRFSAIVVISSYAIISVDILTFYVL